MALYPLPDTSARPVGLAIPAKTAAQEQAAGTARAAESADTAESARVAETAMAGRESERLFVPPEVPGGGALRSPPIPAE